MKGDKNWSAELMHGGARGHAIRLPKIIIKKPRGNTGKIGQLLSGGALLSVLIPQLLYSLHDDIESVSCPLRHSGKLVYFKTLRIEYNVIV